MRSSILAAVLLVGACAGNDGRIVTLSAPDAGPSGDAALAVDPGSGDLLLSWVSGDSGNRHLRFARSSDGGDTWSDPVSVTPDPDDVGPPHGESAPRLVVASGGRVALVWSQSVPVAGRQWPASNIRSARSLDGGRSWSRPVTLNDDSASAPGTHTFHGAAWAGDSGLVAAWLDERGAENFSGHHHPLPNTAADPTSEPDARIFVASSPDFGGRWEKNHAVWGAVCPCCRVSLARRTDGGITAAWRQHLPGNVRDVVTAPLMPAPAEPRRVHRDDWEYPGCPHTGPAIAIAADGTRHVAWYTGKPGGAGIYYAALPDGIDSVAAATPLVVGTVPTAHAALQPAADGGALVALDVSPDGRRSIRLIRVDGAGKVSRSLLVPGSEGGTYPQIAVREDGDVIVAWTAARGESNGIALARASLGR